MNPIYQIDQNLFRTIHVDMQRDWLDFLMVVLSDSGNGLVKFTVLVALCFVIRYRRHAVLALCSGVASGLFAQVVKSLIERQRPTNFSYARPITTYIEALMGQHAPIASNSFPSGHATSCFGIAVAVAWMTYKSDHAWIGWLVMAWAAAVSHSRVYVGVHFVSDVIGGAALGSFIATVLYWIWKKRGWLPVSDH